MEIINVKIGELKPAEYNPRQWSEKAVSDLMASIREFGMVDPIIANSAPTRQNIVIGGHFRLKIAELLGYTEVPVVYVTISDEKKERELNLRLNKNLGAWDYDLLANFDESELKTAGFDQDELDNIFGLDMADDFDEQAEFDKAVKDPKGVKEGDLWKLGEHKLVVGTSTDRKNWERLMGDERFDFMFTDPPYKLAYNKSRTRKVKTSAGSKLKKERVYTKVGETDNKGKFTFGSKGNGVQMSGGVPEFDEWMCHANEFQNPKGANVMIFESWKNIPELWAAIEKYWKIMNMVVWFLPNRHQGFSARRRFYSKYDVAPVAGDGKMNLTDEPELNDYLNHVKEHHQKLLDTYEVILYGQKGNSAWNKEKGSKYWMIGDHLTWGASSEATTGQNVVFGTKPIQVLVPYLKILSPREGIVAEPFGGSGSTIIASEVMKRKCRAIEISPLYAEVIIRRWENFTKQKAEKVV